MEFEVLKQSHLKRNIFIIVGIVLIISAIVLNFTRAKYRVTESIPLVNGTINYSLADLNIVAITVDGEPSDTIPEGNYELTEESYCTVNGEKDNTISLNYDSSTQTLQVIPFTTKGTKCYLDFTKKASAGETILANVTVNEETPDFSQVATTDEAMYAAEDNLGTSYYFRGAVTNNYVKFAGYYWRIIRINGDGSIRIIYDGTSTHANGESSTDRRIQTSKYNDGMNQTYYVGYTYTKVQRPSTQNGGTASTIKEVLDDWYTTNITNLSLDDRVINTAGFCNDRNMANGYSWSIQPASNIRYAPYERVYTTQSPTLKCSRTNDTYTTKIGLITADEVIFAGGIGNNSSYYLYTGNHFWTISPAYATSDRTARVFYVDSSGDISNTLVNSTFGVRPVLNLSADITFSSGNGTISNPYIVN